MDALGLDEMPEALRARLRTRALAAKAMLFRQGDPASALYVVEKGRIALVRHTPEGRRVRLFAAGPGESFAEAALYSEVYHCDAVAETAARVVVIPKAELRRLLARRASLAERLIARLAHQVMDLRLLLELRNVRSANERVWQMLALAAGPAGGPVSFDVPLKSVAERIGLTHEAFYRALAALARAGRIRRRGKRIDLVRPL